MSEEKNGFGFKSWSVESDGTPQGTVVKDPDGKMVPFVQSLSIEVDAENFMPVMKITTLAPKIIMKLPKAFSFFDDYCPECKKTTRFELVSQRPLIAKCPNCDAKLGWGVVSGNKSEEV